MVDVKVGDPDPTPELANPADYCWEPCRLVGRSRTVYCTWQHGHDGDHVSADANPRVVVAVFAGSDLPSGRVWSPRDRKPWVMGPTILGIGEDDWTDQMIREGAKTGVNRQCSIGWHAECSDPDGERCKCACHPQEDEDDDEYVEVPLRALRGLVHAARMFAGSDRPAVEELIAALDVDDLDEEE